jgi:hypothetical protein
MEKKTHLYLVTCAASPNKRIVRAYSPNDARKLIADAFRQLGFGLDASNWSDCEKTSCKLLNPEGKREIIMSDDAEVEAETDGYDCDNGPITLNH